jgi:acetyl-CoA carboxylase biotin carboxyl carrier protein
VADNDEMPDVATVQLVLKEAKDLVRALEGTATSRVRISAGAFAIEIEREGAPIVGGSVGTPVANAGGAAAAAPGLMPVVSPLVGVFYSYASPGAKAFVQVGDRVERGQVVGIVEAMKVMNEVTSDYRGVVKEILVSNGDAVQYEARLMLIDTSGGE